MKKENPTKNYVVKSRPNHAVKKTVKTNVPVKSLYSEDMQEFLAYLTPRNKARADKITGALAKGKSEMPFLRKWTSLKRRLAKKAAKLAKKKASRKPKGKAVRKTNNK